MKRFIVLGMILVISVTPVFKGLFFPFELHIFFAIISVLSALYFGLKLACGEKVIFGSFSTYLNLVLISAYVIALSKAVYLRGNLDAINRYIIYFIVFLIIYDYFKDNLNKVPMYFILPLVTAGFITAILALEGYTGAFPSLKDTILTGRIASTFEYTNTTAVYFLFCTLLIISLIINIDNIVLKSILAGAGNLFFLTLFFTGSRGVFVIIPVIILLIYMVLMPGGYRLRCLGYIVCVTAPILLSMKGYAANAKISNYISASKWAVLSFGAAALSTFVLTCLIYLKVNRRIKQIALGAALLSSVSAMAAYSGTIMNIVKSTLYSVIPQNIMVRLLSININEKNVVFRLQFDLDALKLIKEHWLLGLGGGGWASLYQSVQSRYYAAKLVHNHYLQVFVEAGILGFFAFTALTLVTGMYYIYSLLKLKSSGDKITAAALLCGFIAFAVHSAIDFNISYGGIALMYWCLMGIATAYVYNTKKTNKGDVNEKNQDAVDFATAARS